MDRVLRTFGLQGKSILAMIVSGGLGAGGCAVPGVMAARTLREDKDRLITILVAPFMNCGAKMPVYAMLIGAFFAKAQGAMMFLLWFLSWCFALTSAFFLRKFVIKGEQTPFVMELPVYHMPTFKGVLMDTWHRTYMFIKKAATIILAVSIVMWALMYYPRYDSKPTEKVIEKLQSSLSQKTAKSKFAPVLNSKEIEATESASYEPEKIKNLKGIEKLRGEFTLAVNEFKAGKKVENQKVIVDYLEYCKTKQELENKLSENQLLNSIAGRIGHFLVPVSQLAGFQWKENIALIGGFAAKEVVLGTLGTAYSMGDATENPEPLSKILAHHPDWNPLRAFVMLVFVMAYAPCVVTIATIKKETGKWSWALFSTAYSTTLAFIVATVIYQIGSLF
jgi:ferrous iron transport protein B